MAALRQTSFAAGELSPYLYGRTDLDLFRHGARRLRNFIINKQGSAVSRPGGQYVWTAREPSVVLAPFLRSDGDSYVFEFTDLVLRIYNASTLALGVELASPFRNGDLKALQWAQTGNVMTVTHPSRPAQEIHFGFTIPTIQPVRFGPPGDNLADPPLSAKFPSIDGNPEAMPVLVAWQPTSLFVVDAAHPPREWRYKVSTLLRHRFTREVIESLALDITDYSLGNASTGTVSSSVVLPIPPDNLLILFSDAPIYIAPGYGAPVAPAANWVPIENVYYRGRGSLFGLVGSSKTNDLFADFGAEPNYGIPPLRGDSPFRAGEYPAAVAYFQQRRALAGPNGRSNTWWASAVDAWANHDAPVANWPGQPLEATLLGRRREKIVTMAVLEHLFVLTDTSVWQVGRNDVPLDFNTMPAVTRLVDEVGALELAPLVVGDALLYAVAQGRGVRYLRQSGQAGNFTPADASWQAEHLFRGRNSRIISWCYQRSPWGVVWAVRDDGVLLSCTRTGDDSWAWAVHDTGGGKVVSVVCVPASDSTAIKGDFDVVFMAVKRGQPGDLLTSSSSSSELNTYVERLTPHVVDDPPLYDDDPEYTGNEIGSEQLSYPLDSYSVVSIFEDADTVLAGLGRLEGREVWLSCPGIEPLGPFVVVGGSITVPAGWGPSNSHKPTTGLLLGPNVFTAAVGLLFEPELELLDASPGTSSQKTVVSVGFEIDQAAGIAVGEDFDHLIEWENRTPEDNYEFPSNASAYAVVNVTGAWRRTGRAVLRQTRPLPVTVLGITRELGEGGK